MAQMNIINLPQLQSENFNNWLFRLEIALDEKGVKEHIQTKIELKDNETLKKDAKARNLIVQALPDKFLEYVKNVDTAFDMVSNLRKIFERKSTISTIYIRKELINLKCKKSDNVEEHFIKFEKLINKIKANGGTMEQKDVICQLLISLEEAYQEVVTALELCDTPLTIEFVKSKILDTELKRKSQRSNSTTINKDYVFQNTQIKCFRCGKLNHIARNCKTQISSYNTSNYNTLKYHRNINNRRNTFNNKRENANFSEERENKDYVTFIALQAYTNNIEGKHLNEIEFVIDSGSSYHMVSNRYERFMKNITMIPHIKIQVANGNILTANKKGELIGISKEGHQITIKDCLIIEKLSHNLISVLRLNEKGLKVTFEERKATISNKNIRIEGHSNGKLCTVRLNLNYDTSLILKKMDTNLWHRRMGHLNYGGMKILGLPISSERCTICMEAKATRCSFTSIPLPRTNSIGELVYCDIGGPVTPMSAEDDRYYLTIIDDYSHFLEIYLIKTKDEAKHHIINYVNRMKNNNINIRRIRTDRGTEFLNQTLRIFYEKNGIKQETTCAYTPQQNSVCERMNRTLLDKVRAMLLETNLPKHLWSEAIRCAAYVINRSPTKALKGDTPARMWYGKNQLDKIRVFGSRAWNVILPRQNKLEPRAKPMIMVGYCGSGYRLWDPMTNDVIISRDVRFDESNFKYENNMNTHIVINKDTETESDDEEEYSECDPDNTPENITGYTESLRESQNNNVKRKIRLPKHFEDYDMTNIAFALMTEHDPKCYSEAIKQEEWSEAIQKELDAHKRLGTWEKSELPKGCKAITTKWIFRTKSDDTKKARLVARGFQEETTQNVYAPVARMTTVRLFLNKAVQQGFNIKQLDIPTAFLNGELKSEVYIKYPEGLEHEEGKVLKLRRALYGLKEAPRCWNDKLKETLLKTGLEQSQNDFCLYTGNNVYVLIYVDDILVMGNGQAVINKLKEQFKAKDLGNINKFLGMEITNSNGGMKIKQTQIIEKILIKYNMQDCKGINTPMEIGINVESEKHNILINIPYRELVGALMYIATISRPDIAYSTGFLSRYLDCPTPILWQAAKRVLRYLKQTKDKGLIYRKDNTNKNYLQAFSDSDWGSEKMDRKSVSGTTIFHQGNLVTWCSRKQHTVALSTAESEYVAAALTYLTRIY